MAMKISETLGREMIETGGHLNIVDVYTINTAECMDCLCFTSTKKALQGLVKAVAKELHPYNVRMNCIIRGGDVRPPGRTNTRRLSENVLKFIEDVVSKMARKNDSETDELSDLILLLLSPFASLIVGKSLVVSD